MIGGELILVHGFDFLMTPGMVNDGTAMIRSDFGFAQYKLTSGGGKEEFRQLVIVTIIILKDYNNRIHSNRKKLRSFLALLFSAGDACVDKILHVVRQRLKYMKRKKYR